MTTNAIRVQLPGGDIYAPAFDQAASKTGARSGLPRRHITGLTTMVSASIVALNSADADMITLEMVVHDDAISAKLIGKNCTSPSKRASNALAKHADKHTSSFQVTAGASGLTITFDV